MKSLFSYHSTSEYLRACYLNAKNDSRGMTLESYARKLGLGHSAFKMILTGKRRLTLRKAHQVCNYFRFNEEERGYFEALLLKESSKTSRETRLYHRRAVNAKARSQLQGCLVSDRNLLEQIYTLPILVYLTDIKKLKVKDFLNSRSLIEEVAKKFRLSTVVTEKIVEKLKIAQVLPDGECENEIHYVFDKGSGVFNQKRYLKNWLAESAIRVESAFEDSRTYFTASTISLSEEAMQAMNLELRAILNKYLALSEPAQNKNVVQVGIQSYPLLD